MTLRPLPERTLSLLRLAAVAALLAAAGPARAQDAPAAGIQLPAGGARAHRRRGARRPARRRRPRLHVAPGARRPHVGALRHAAGGAGGMDGAGAARDAGAARQRRAGARGRPARPRDPAAHRGGDGAAPAAAAVGAARPQAALAAARRLPAAGRLGDAGRARGAGGAAGWRRPAGATGSTPRTAPTRALAGLARTLGKPVVSLESPDVQLALLVGNPKRGRAIDRLDAVAGRGRHRAADAAAPRHRLVRGAARRPGELPPVVRLHEDRGRPGARAPARRRAQRRCSPRASRRCTPRESASSRRSAACTWSARPACRRGWRRWASASSGSSSAAAAAPRRRRPGRR